MKIQPRTIKHEKFKELVREWLDTHREEYCAFANEVSKRDRLGFQHMRWDAMMRVLDDRRLLIDNNLAENEIRPITLGRKNYLFCGNHESAENMYVIQSPRCRTSSRRPKMS